MLFPNISDYKNAIVIPESFATLGNLRPENGLLGDIYFSSGNFAVVFKMRDVQTGKLHAVKCFTREQERRTESLDSISRYLGALRSPYIVPYTFLKDEIWVNDADYPVLLMDWVDGVTLGEKVKTLCAARDTEGLHRLTVAFAEMALWLLEQDWAHGDLKHDNIMVRPDDSLALVDYDGCFVPAMSGQNAREIGSPCYRHPKRTAQHFDRHIDDFSILVIFLSLRALSQNPDLFESHQNGENLLFSVADLAEPQGSVLLGQLRRSADTYMQGAVGLLDFSVAMGCRKILEVKSKIMGFFFNEDFKLKKLDFEPDMIFVEGGTFQMGSDGGEYNEKPIHEEIMNNFYIGKFPITQREWKSFININPSYFRGDKLPVERVSWDDCQEFIKKLNEKTGKKYRLPTEAEWEYSARGGNQSKGYKYSGSNNIEEISWYKNNSDKKTHSIGLKKANELGIYDMSGNVWEWCNGWFQANYYKNNLLESHEFRLNSSFRILRGGSWFNDAYRCRTSFRFKHSSSTRNDNNGFRLALDINISYI